MKKGFITKEKIILIAECVITFLFCVLFVFKRNMIIMSADEMGPISIAAYWSGYDWSEVMSHGAYYSYGYSFILYPLFLLFKTPEMFYKSAIVVNALLSSLITFIAWLSVKEIKPDSKTFYRLAVVLLCGANTVNIARSASAWAEVFLCFICWALFYFVIKTYKEGKIGYYLLTSFIATLLYVTHQRAIGIFVVVHAFVFYISLFESKRLKNLLAYISSTSLLMVIHLFIKRGIKNNVWNGSASSETNDYKMYLIRYFGENYLVVAIMAALLCVLILVSIVLIAIRLKKRYSENNSVIERYKKILLCIFLVICFCGVMFLLGKHLDLALYTASAQILYMGMSSLGLAYLGIIFCFTATIQKLSSRDEQSKNVNSEIYIFALLCFLALFAIGIVSTYTSADPMVAARSDYMFYGRYFEPMLGIVCFLGAVNLDEIHQRRIFYSIVSLTIVSFTFIAIERYELFKGIPFLLHNCVAAQIYAKNGIVNFIAADVVVSIFLILFIWIKKEARSFALILCVCLSVFSAAAYVIESVIPMEQSKYEYKTLLEEKEELDPDASFYYFGQEENYIFNSSFAQFLMPKHKSLKYGDIYNLPQEEFYAITDDLAFLLDNPSLNVIDAVSDLYLVNNKDTFDDNYGISIPLEMFSFTDAVNEIESDYSTSDYKVFMHGPYIALDKGEYEVSLFYSSNEEGSAFINISGNNGSDYIGAEMMNLGEEQMMVLPFSIDKKTEGIEFRVYVSNVKGMDIQKVLIKKYEQ